MLAALEREMAGYRPVTHGALPPFSGSGERARVLGVRDARGETQVRAQYLIAADGARSPVRRTLGVAMHGVSQLYRSVNVLMPSTSDAGLSRSEGVKPR